MTDLELEFVNSNVDDFVVVASIGFFCCFLITAYEVECFCLTSHG